MSKGVNFRQSLLISLLGEKETRKIGNFILFKHSNNLPYVDVLPEDLYNEKIEIDKLKSDKKEKWKQFRTTYKEKAKISYKKPQPISDEELEYIT